MIIHILILVVVVTLGDLKSPYVQFNTPLQEY